MCKPEEDPGWLQEIRVRAAHADYGWLEDLASQTRLVRGFIVCNLLMDLVDFLREVICASPEVIAQGISYGTVRDWLDAPLPRNPPVPPEAGDLVSDQAREEIDSGADAEDPWRRINRWLVIEAILRNLSDPPAASTGAAAHARQTFDSILATRPLLNPAPVVCTQRNAAVTRAFDAWWEVTAARLTTAIPVIWQQVNALTELCRQEGPEDPVDLNQEIIRLLGEQLLEPGPKPAQRCAGPVVEKLVKLLGEKYSQLVSCTGKLTESVTSPLDAGWVSELARKGESRLKAGLDLRLAWPDIVRLSRLLLWILANGLLGSWLGGPGLLQQGVIWKALFGATFPISLLPIGFRTAATISAQDLSKFMVEFAALELIKRIRGLPNHWGMLPWVADLFFHPMVKNGRPFNRGEWYDRTDLYWPLPEA